MKRPLLAAALLAAAAVLVPLAPAAASASTLSCAPDPYETTPEPSPDLAMGVTVNRAICQAPDTARDVDQFWFTASGTQAYEVEATNLGSALITDFNGQTGLVVGVYSVAADGTMTSVPQTYSRTAGWVITSVLPAGRYLVWAASGMGEFDGAVTHPTTTIQGAAGTYSMTVRPGAPAATVTGLTLSPSSVNGGKTVTATYTVSRAPLTGGAYIFTSTSDGFVANPQTTYVPAGATSVSFPITTRRVSVNTNITITVTTGLGAAKAAVLTVKK